MTDEELLLLEQITYLDKEVYSAAGLSKKNIKIRENKTVGELLKDFDDNALNKLSTYDCNDIDYTGYNGVGPSYGLELGGSISSGKEWADIIRTIQNNKELSSLKPEKNSLEVLELFLCQLLPKMIMVLQHYLIILDKKY